MLRHELLDEQLNNFKFTKLIIHNASGIEEDELADNMVEETENLTCTPISIHSISSQTDPDESVQIPKQNQSELFQSANKVTNNPPDNYSIHTFKSFHVRLREYNNVKGRIFNASLLPSSLYRGTKLSVTRLLGSGKL